MKSTQLTTCALGLLSLILLTQCAVVPTDPNAGSMRGGYGDYNYSGYNPSFQPYEAPARVSELSNGKYLVTINARVAAYDSSGRLMSSSGLSPNERYHADAAVESYREGHRGDYHHPNHSSHTSSRHTGAPTVRPRADGKIDDAPATLAKAGPRARRR